MATEKDQLDILVERLFRILDTDENGLIDALETQVTMCALSSMSIDEKAEFMFNCFEQQLTQTLEIPKTFQRDHCFFIVFYLNNYTLSLIYTLRYSV